jgi:uncharacterized protein YbjT (DUF2867 family)|uniref:NmrA-like domain-containing protein n=1 Tax=Phaeodactylum tricornutum TaxID=2850 RepID=A0A8J9T4L7_PHATR
MPQRVTAMTSNSLFLVGGTGSLGQAIAKGLRSAEGFSAYVALVRPTSIDGIEALLLRGTGWTVVSVDFSDHAFLEVSLKGARTVVSTISGNDLVAVESAVIKAAKKNGATLFVPSQFGLDFRRWGNSFPLLAVKNAVLEVAKEINLPTLIVFTGMFSDFIFSFLVDLEESKARVIGDGSGKVSFTLRSDIGYVLAKALADPTYKKGGTLSMQGDTMSWRDALALLEKATGRDLALEYINPESALLLEKDLLQKGLDGELGSYYAAFGLHLLGEPQRGNNGGDTSAEAQTYGLTLESLETTLNRIYGK